MSKSVDFVARLRLKQGKVSVSQQLGQAVFETKKSTEIGSDELERFLFDTRVAITSYDNSLSQQREHWEQMEREFAAKLLHTLFASTDALSSLVHLIQEENNLVRIIVETPDNELSRIPWELCANAKQLSVSSKDLPNITVVRTAGLSNTSWVIPSTVRVLVFGTQAAPKYVEEVERIRSAFSNSKKGGRPISLELEEVPSADPATLENWAKEFMPHIIHLVAHGDEGEVMLQDSQGDEWPIGPHELAQRLPDPKSESAALSLFVTTACLSARSKAYSSSISNVGFTLSNLGIPAVIGMQFQVTPEAACTFTGELYGALALSQTLTGAFVIARNRLFTKRKQSPEWAAPVLYVSQRKDEPLLTPNIAYFLDGKRDELRALMDAVRYADVDQSSKVLKDVLRIVNKLHEVIVEDSIFTPDLFTSKQHQCLPSIRSSIKESRERAGEMLEIVELKKEDPAAKLKFNFFKLNEDLLEALLNLMEKIGELINVSF